MIGTTSHPMAFRVTLLVLLLHCGVAFLPSHHSSTRAIENAISFRQYMFTGIVEEIGTVKALEERDDILMWDGSTGKGTVITVEASIAIKGAYPGCRICVSGVSLTATEIRPEENLFVGLVPPETLRTTYLGCLAPGDKVNLERPSEISGRTSGHFVQGNVDSWGEVMERQDDGNLILFKVKVPAELLKYIVPKGFVAIDGTSLTVFQVNQSECWFTFAPATASIVLHKDVGDPVNVEVDVLGKYSENAVAALMPRLEELENKYRQLQSKTALLEAINEELEQKIQSLENVRLLDNGAHNFIPNAKLVGGPEARRANEDWIRERVGMNDDKASQKDRPGASPGSGHPREMVRGKEAQQVNNEWLRQQKIKNDDWLRRQDMAGPQNLNRGVDVVGEPNATIRRDEDLLQKPKKHANFAGAPDAGRVFTKDRPLQPNMNGMVSGEEAQRVNNDWLRQQQLKNEEWLRQQIPGSRPPQEPPAKKVEKFSVSGKEAQRVNDEWRRQKAMEQERFSRVKRVRDEENGTDEGAAHDGFPRPRKFKTMVAGRHAKKINDEWLQQTGKELYEEEIEDAGLKIEDATVVGREAGSEWKYVVENDQDAFGRREKKHTMLNQRPGQHLDIQDATLVDNDKDEFLMSQFEAENTEASDQETPTVLDTEVTRTPQDPYQEISDQHTAYQQLDPMEDQVQKGMYDGNQYREGPKGAFNDGWFNKSGQNLDQNAEGITGSIHPHEDTGPTSGKGQSPVQGLQPDSGLHLTGLNPDQNGNAWGRRLF